MSSSQSLALYQELIPSLSMPGKRRKYDESDPAYLLLNSRKEVAVFDCRAMPSAFIDDTGDAVFEELKQTRAEIHLPFSDCYFEFADEPRMVYATEDNYYLPIFNTDFSRQPRGRVPEGHMKYLGFEIDVYDLAINVKFSGVAGSFGFGEPLPGTVYKFYETINPRPLERNEHWELVGKRVLAIITLLREQLVIDKLSPDPSPKISRERERKQKPAVSGDSHVLTINVPIVRYRAARSTPQIDTHESPALHWRRGHWRVYNRGTNFQQAGWVRRCLVGDPDKGYRNIQYRLVHRPEPFRIIQGGIHDQVELA